MERCPWCGTPFDATHGYCATEDEFHFHCTDRACDFGADPRPLPCNVVNEALYEPPPSLLIGTIDKFARIAWEERTGAFFGAGTGSRPPELVIQDELHLITGPLGSVAGLYEAGLDTLLVRRGVRPKYIASTATIRMAREQVRRLYARDLSVFPPPGLSHDDTCFARTDRERPGRLYVGYLAPMLDQQHCLAPLAAVLLAGPRALFDGDADRDELLDAWWTQVVYHGSLKGVGNSHNAFVTDVRDFSRRLVHELREERETGSDDEPGVHAEELEDPLEGKSVLALIRARRYLREQNDHVFLVFNHLLNRASGQLFGDGLAGRTWVSWFLGRLEQITGLPVPRLESGNNGFEEIDWAGVDEIVQALPDGGDRRPPFLVIDEGQDMPREFYSALVGLGFDRFFVVADQNQQITEANNSRKDIEGCLAIDTGEVIELRQNYRNHYPVARLAREFHTGDPASPPPELPGTAPGAVPLLYYYEQDNLDAVARGILRLADRDPRQLIGIITPTNRVRERYLEALRSVQVRLDNPRPTIETYHRENRAEVAFDEGGILVINAQACKGLEFDTVVLAVRVRPLRELFGDGSTWRCREKSAARELARAQKWDCVHTRINLGQGEYRLIVKGGSAHIDLPGEPKISPEIDLDRFFELLSAARLDHKTEAKIRGELRG